MNRVIKFTVGTVDELNNLKYVLDREYRGFGIYDEMCPNGLLRHQSYLIANDKIAVVCESYNSLCVEELMDCIDSYNDIKKFELRGFYKGEIDGRKVYIVHQNGNCKF